MSTTKRKVAFNSSPSSQQIVSSYLPDECWESIFRFIVDNNANDNNNNNHLNSKSLVTKKFFYLNSLSLVSKRFLSITNRLRFSLTIYKESTSCHIFKRFTNLNSLNLTNCINLDELLCQISHLPLKLTSLNITYQPTIPANALRSFSKKITTLTSLACYYIDNFNSSDLFLIAECFPLLQKLVLSSCSSDQNDSSYVDGIEALSIALINLRKVDLSGIPINNQSLFHLFNNCKQLEEVKINCDGYITNAGINCALHKRPTLRSLSFSTLKHKEVFSTSYFIDTLVSLKGLTSLVLQDLNISDELLYSIADEGLPLTTLDLHYCTNYSYNGIFYLLSKCRRLQHLGLQKAHFLNDQHVVELSLLLGDLLSINLSCCHQLTKSALFALARNCHSLSEIKMERIRSNVTRSLDPPGRFVVNPQLKYLYLSGNPWLNDKSVIKIASIFPNLLLLDLSFCNRISEGICQVFRNCCKIRHMNLANCPKVKLLGLNFVVPKLELLDLSYTKVDDETLYMISKNCCGLLQLFLRKCDGITEKGVKHVVENCNGVLIWQNFGFPPLSSTTLGCYSV